MACCLLSVAMLAAGAVGLIASRVDAWNQADKEAHNLALTLDRDIRRTLNNYDETIQGVGRLFMQPGLDKIPEPFRQAALFDRASAIEYQNRVVISDATGKVIAHQGMDTLPTLAMNIADREYFTFHKTHPQDRLFISQAIKSRIEDNLWVLALSRSLPSPDGHFLGVVVIGLRLNYLQETFSKLLLGRDGVIVLTRTDGWILARSPYNVHNINRSVAGSEIFSHFGKANVGEYVGSSRTDGIRRLYVYRHIGNYPLIISVGVALNDIYAAWWKRTILIGGVLLAFSAATMVLCLLFRGELLRRIAAEENMADTAAELAIMASTDALTGLGNRRSWEAQLGKAWKRAARDQRSLAVLMIDADHFKLYNDRYGHQEGDDVLRMIAKTVVQHLRRPDDFAARYGGEEIAVILPGADAEGAERIADNIRQAIYALGLPHDGSVAGRVSVSIGVAASTPTATNTPARLMRLADDALYDAKQRGRNGVTLAGGTTAWPIGVI
ncbi:MAG TPA: diguanylate cyclase [Stellaceae bacterium]|nr:diguanylate cyclase [Stellaceae bacterium]